MIIQMKDVFDGRGPVCHQAYKEAPSLMPNQEHREFPCTGCGELLRIENNALLMLVNVLLVGVTCPKCGRNQGIGQVSRMMVVDFGTSNGSPGANLCALAIREAEEYWNTAFEVRVWKYKWIDGHVLMCHSCDQVYKEKEKSHHRKRAYEKERGPRDWSPKGELP